MSELLAIEKSVLTGIGDAIRTRKDSTDPIPVTDIAGQITGFPTVRIGGEKVTRDYNLEINKIMMSVSTLTNSVTEKSRAIVYKDNIYIFVPGTNKMEVYDGSTWTVKTRSGGSSSTVYGQPWVYNDELYYYVKTGYSGDSGATLYKFDGATSTKICGQGTYYYKQDGSQYIAYYAYNGCAMFQGNVYMFGKTNSYDTQGQWEGHWRYDPTNQTLVKVGTLPFTPNGDDIYFEFNEKLHRIGWDNIHYTWDGDAWTNIGTPPFSYLEYGASYSKGRILILDDGVHVYGPYPHASYPTLTREHLLWNGSEWTRLEDLPVDLSYGVMVEFEGNMHYLGSGTTSGAKTHLVEIEAYKEV